MILTGQMLKIFMAALNKLNVPYSNSCKNCERTEFAPIGIRGGVIHYYNAKTGEWETIIPTLDSLVVENAAPTKIVLTYAVLLDPTSVPATSAFTASGGKTVSSVAVSGNTVTITVNSAYVNGNAITLTYAVPVSNFLKDNYGNPAAAFTTKTVTNNIL